MKPIFLAVTLLFVACISYSQNVTIPDANFKNALISVGVDTSGDGEISNAEAEATYNLNVEEKSISDMTGIEAFVNLDTLLCNNNQLTSLDVTNNTALGYLSCEYNQLTSLDVSGCSALIVLSCGYNQLTSLDVTNNTGLQQLYCGYNQLTSLDVTNNTALTALECEGIGLTSLDVTNNTSLGGLHCSYNRLTSLDISNNTALISLHLNDMPTLFKVCVWKIPFNFYWVDTTASPNVYFTTDCAATSLKPDKLNSRINIYPNPAKEYILFDIANISSSATVALFDLQGKKVLEQKLAENKQVSVSNLPKGLYMYKLNNKGVIYKGKLIIE